MIAIIGAGIAGLSTALALKKQGIECAVFERNKELKAVGAGIIMSPNALYILEQLGLKEQIESQGYPLKDFRLATASGKTMQSNPTNYHKNDIHYQSIGIARAKLHKLLAEDLQDIIYLDHEVSSIATNQLKFISGKTINANAVLIADGLHSKLRQQLFPKSKKRYSGQSCWRAIVDINLEERHMQPAEFWGNGIRFGYVPIAEDKIYFYTTVRQKEGGITDTHESLDMLKHLFNDFAKPIPELLQNTQATNLMQHDLSDIAPLKRYSQDHYLLLGDAAHAMTPNLGQGAAQAIEDAGMISYCLKKHALDYSKAFTEFENTRLKKASSLVKTSWLLGQITNPVNPLICTLRNSLLSLAPSNTGEKQLEKLMRNLADL